MTPQQKKEIIGLFLFKDIRSTFLSMVISVLVGEKERMKWNVLFNDTFNTFLFMVIGPIR